MEKYVFSHGRLQFTWNWKSDFSPYLSSLSGGVIGFYLVEQSIGEIKWNAISVLILHTNIPFFCLDLQKYFATLKELSVISELDCLFIGSHITDYETLMLM